MGWGLVSRPMKKLIPFVLATAAALAFSTTASAQSAQERLDERYNLALAAGYKALFMCGAIANAERNGASRTPESVHEWELTGVYSAIDGIVRDLDYRIVREDEGNVARVEVDWAEDMPARFATATRIGGCRLAPIGLEPMLPYFWGYTPSELIELETGRANDKFAQGLEAQFVAAFDGSYGPGSRTTAVVVRSGALSAEEYADGFGRLTPQRTWSVAKSIAATLIGAAVYQGQVDVNEPLEREEWRRDARAELTIDHLLRMASGRYSDTPGNRTDPLYAGGSTVEETATDWPLIYKPGTKYRYANNDTLMAVKAITDTDKPFEPTVFFAAAGMDHTVAETDWQGDYILSSQVWATAPDLADLGQIYLNDGVLSDGTRVLPEGWTKYVSDPSGPQPVDTNWGYGAGWWTFRRPEGNAFEGIPDDAFAARGNRGQYVVVVPSRNVVIVRRGEDMVGTRFDIAAFTRDVLAALEE